MDGNHRNPQLTILDGNDVINDPRGQKRNGFVYIAQNIRINPVITRVSHSDLRAITFGSCERG